MMNKWLRTLCLSLIATFSLASFAAVPAKDGEWLFDNSNNLYASTAGSLELVPCKVGTYNVAPVAYAADEDTGVEKTEKGIYLPKSTCLFLGLNEENDLTSYTLVYDIKTAYASRDYTSLLQTNLKNADDGDIFITKNKVGINFGGLGYVGGIVDNEWCRIALVVDEGYMSIYINGEFFKKSETSYSKWTISKEGVYLFLDNDGESMPIEVDGIHFWKQALADEEIADLGMPGQNNQGEVVYDEFPITIGKGSENLNGYPVLEGAFVDESGIVTYESRVYRFSESLTKVRFTVKETGMNILCGDYPFFSLSGFEMFDEHGNEIMLSEEDIVSNADHNILTGYGDGSGILGLIDDKSNTYFHSVWVTSYAVDEHHYLEVTLPEGKYSAFSFKMTCRDSHGSQQFPAVLEINNGDFKYEDYTDEQGVVYSVNEDMKEYVVSDFSDNLTSDIVIASEIYGLPVTGIKERAFAVADGLRSVVIPGNIKEVGKYAFYGCRNLLTVEWNTTATVDANCFDIPEYHGNMLVFVDNANTKVTYEGNAIVDGVADQITFADGKAFRNPKQFTARNITFIREFTKKTKIGVAGGWEALVVPFDVQRVVSENRGELKPFGEADFTSSLPYSLGELKADGTFAITQRITANKPFIMQLPNSDEYEDIYNIEGKVTFSAENTTVHATTNITQEVGNGYVMHFSYEGTPADRRIYALNEEEYAADGEVYMPGGVFVANSRDILPFEAYVYSSQITLAPYLRIGGKVDTGLGCPTLNPQDSTIYDLTGRKMLKTENLKGGIYIVNGRKVIIK